MVYFAVAKTTYRSRDGKHIYIKQSDGEYICYKFLARPQEKWIPLEQALELNDSPHNHRFCSSICR
jgi:hypothetical protein